MYIFFCLGFRYRKPDINELDEALPGKVGSMFQCKFCKRMDFLNLQNVNTYLLWLENDFYVTLTSFRLSLIYAFIIGLGPL